MNERDKTLKLASGLVSGTRLLLCSLQSRRGIKILEKAYRMEIIDDQGKQTI